MVGGRSPTGKCAVLPRGRTDLFFFSRSHLKLKVVKLTTFEKGRDNVI